MELGNMFSGHSRCEFEVERDDDWVKCIYALTKKINPNYEKYPDFGTIPIFENDVFSIRPYWWGDENAKETSMPNFHYKSTGYRLSWYKYPLRDSYANRKISTAEFLKIIDSCIKSLKRRRDKYKIQREAGNGRNK